MKEAVKAKPYIVTELTFIDIMNFEKANVDCIKGNALNGIQSTHYIKYYKNENGDKNKLC